MKQVLIIDDAAEDLELLSTLVEHSANTTAIAFSNGADGFEYFRTYGADCILLDHRLNGEDGLALLDAFRSQSLFLPLILMSGQGDEELAAMAIENGANSYLSKSALTKEKVLQSIENAAQDCEDARQKAGFDGSAKQVLLVEDNDDDRRHIAEMISAANNGTKVSAVATGTEAMAVFEAENVDCVILDYRLEAEDGLTILKEMKKAAPFCPVIMLTGQGNEVVAAKSIKVGASDYLVKQRLTKIYLRTAIENAISRAALEAKVAEQEKQRRQFLNILVHDLRAPLNNVRSLGEMIADEAEAGDVKGLKDMLTLQGNVARHANELIGSLESYALLDGEVHFDSVLLNDVVKAAKNNLNTTIVERNATIEIAELPVVNGDATQLTQLFQNLIQNALKYNEDDRPFVSISSQADGSNRVIISVSDNGIGIPAKFLETIFAPLKRLWGNSKYEGTGLGLAICQKVVERHGGTISCTSTEGKGSQFHIRLPCAEL